MQYELKRIEAKECILKTIDKYGLTKNHLKGSWQADDFHLSIKDNITYSDVDLLVTGLDTTERTKLSADISSDLAEHLACQINVSIHNQNSLGKMSTSDAQILGIAEYIAQYQKIQATASHSKDYINTKFTLLLLRESLYERYQDVAARIGTPEAERALDVKLGKESEFPIEYAASLISAFGNATAILFLNRCIMKPPSDDDAKMVLNSLAQCETIDKWLHNYLVNKINRYLAV